jgi:dTDP-4-dehydrorhamnose reductase
MKVLITGGSGLLGKYLLETKPHNIDVALTWNKILGGVITNPDIWYKLDIRDRASVFDLFEITRPDLVVHCAAIGSVDFAERRKDDKRGYQATFDVNITGTKHIIDACNGYKSKVIYISSNAVYSGNLPPYNEKSTLEPINDYGRIKVHAEQTIRDTAKKWLIIRPFLLYGWPYIGGRNNWASSIVEKLTDSKGSYKLVNDHIWMPTYAGDMAQTIWQLFNEDHEIYNIASPERATLYEFGLKVCDVFDLEKNLIRPIESDYFPTIAPRPKDTTYDLVKLTRQGIVLSDIKTGLEKMKGVQNG